MDRKNLKSEYEILAEANKKRDRAYEDLAKFVIKQDVTPETSMYIFAELASNGIQFFIDRAENEKHANDIIDGYINALRNMIEEKRKYLKNKRKGRGNAKL